ncbi:MAG: hypothetical protein CMP24_05680 [Rickettsiales bacterium]|nr:hypothetical protein [Rickettsiales bacterium]|tara:strand:- start:260 stop:706 length:447 start_codon:yes stop_codon:yes gene_type:complete
MDKRTPEDIRKSIKNLVEEAENVSVDDSSASENSPARDIHKSELEEVPKSVESKYKINTNKSETKKSEEELDLDLTGLISDDVALAVRAELMRYSDVFDTDDTKEIIYKSVTTATREMVREWLDQNLATIAKEVINEALDKLSKNARN